MPKLIFRVQPHHHDKEDQKSEAQVAIALPIVLQQQKPEPPQSKPERWPDSTSSSPGDLRWP
jgi:hypothetical protein